MSDLYSADRAARRLARDKRRRRRIWKRRGLIAAAVLVVAALVCLLLLRDNGQEPDPTPSSQPAVNAVVTPAPTPTPTPEPTPQEVFFSTDATVTLPDSFSSLNAVLLDADTGEILARRDSDVSVDPASMTKVLTLLVAAEQIPDRTGTWTMTADVSDYCYVNKCSVVGYKNGEVVPVEELFYGCILCSGADACLGLAQLAAGSHEAFVELMNEKLVELGIDDTAHFTNCVGLYDEDHHCTMEDMALILRTALEDDFCRKILTTKLLMSEPTEQHPEGQALSNWFIRRIEDQDTGSVNVLAGKTGYVEESGFCAASYAESDTGRRYLCVTAHSTGTWQCIYDHAELYRTYCE